WTQRPTQRSAMARGTTSTSPHSQRRSAWQRRYHQETAERKKRRAGTRESAKRRKRQKRENDILCVKQAGIAVPSLSEVLKGSKGAIVIPSLKEALTKPEASEVKEPKAQLEESASAQLAQGEPLPVPVRQPVCYEDLEDDAPTPSAPSAPSAPFAPVDATEAAEVAGDAEADSPQVDHNRLALALNRLAKDSKRRARVAEAAKARSVFITNLPFKAKEEEIRGWLEPAGDIKGLRLNRDKVTTKALGYGHVQFASPQAAEAAVKQCDKIELHGRVMRVAPVSSEKFQFELPNNIKEDLRALISEAYEGMNISTIKDAWQCRHPGEKLNTTKWGFKNFSAALRTLEGVQLEHHLDKTLTFLAFFQDSPAHRAFLEAKAKKMAAAPPEMTPGEVRRAAAEADIPESRKSKVAKVETANGDSKVSATKRSALAVCAEVAAG
ncbi:unnamed protein product, partial [Effrenium voratum]